MAPEALVIAGPNGSGKTTFAHEYLRSDPRPFLSADHIAAGLSPSDPSKVRVEAGRQLSAELTRVVSDGRSFAIESTLSGSTLARSLRDMRTHGFSISIVFVFLRSPDACVARIRERVAKGGHDVAEADVRRRYLRSISNFWVRYRPLADRWFLFYNGGAQFHEVALGEAGSVEVQDDALFEVFRQLAEGAAG